MCKLLSLDNVVLIMDDYSYVGRMDSGWRASVWVGGCWAEAAAAVRHQHPHQALLM